MPLAWQICLFDGILPTLHLSYLGRPTSPPPTFFKSKSKNISTCPSWEWNPGFLIYRQTLYHVAVKAQNLKELELKCVIYLDPVTFTLSNLKFIPEFLGTGIIWHETKRNIYAQNNHREGDLWWAWRPP